MFSALFYLFLLFSVVWYFLDYFTFLYLFYLAIAGMYLSNYFYHHLFDLWYRNLSIQSLLIDWLRILSFHFQINKNTNFLTHLARTRLFGFVIDH